MKSKILKILFLLLFPLVSYAQALLPFVENYSKYNYQGDNQTWNVVQGKDAAMYFANNHYLLRYDGVKWEKYNLPNKTIIRSIFVDEDKIFSGSYKEFGYWERKNGKMYYTSISKNKKLFNDNGNEEIWKIFKFNNAIYFQSFNEIYTFKNGKIDRINLPFQISYAFVIDGELLLASIKDGVFKLKETSFEKIKTWKIVENNVIHAIEKKGNSYYVFTQKNGVFVGDQLRLKPWDNPLNVALKSSFINTAQFLNANKLIIGTSSQGVYILDFLNKSTLNINRNNILINNSVLGIAFDKEQNLWLGLDNGIAQIEINSPVSIFSDNTGMLGSVYAIAKIKDSYLMASNHGIFNFEDKVLSALPNVQGQAWDISKVNNQYVIGHSEGTFLYENSTLSKLNPINGGWNFSKSNINSSYLQAAYSGVVIYNDSQDFKKYHQIKDFYKPIKYVAQNKLNEIWAADNYRGLYRVMYDDNFKATEVENITAKNKISNDFGIKIFEFRKEILFLIDSRWYTYNSLTNTLEKSKLFNANFAAVSDLIAIDENSFLVLQSNLLYLIQTKGNKFIWNLIQEKYYRGKIINDNLKIFYDNNQYFLNLDNGFISLQFEKNKNSKPTITVEAFNNQKLISENSKIKYNSELELHVITGLYGYKNPNLFYKIDNSEKLFSVNNGLIIINNLDSAAHQISIFYNDGEKMNESSVYNFTVANPWYFSFYMIILYLFIIGLILLLYYRWNKLRYNQKLAIREEELRHQKKILEMQLKTENQLNVQEYEKHILELEIQTKSSEVAGKSLSIAKQSEMIENIHNILEVESDLNRLKSEIKKSIKINSINKHEWEVFENNLNQIHNEFIVNLLKEFPNLTSKDIKLCVYLKMNLASKEIAPLMNISFRGVELHRYRLRKKLALKTTENLNKFFLSI